MREIGASNLDEAQLRAALDVAAQKGFPRYSILQPQYNLYDCDRFEGPLRDLTMSEGVDVITYFSLDKGFLSPASIEPRRISGRVLAAAR